MSNPAIFVFYYIYNFTLFLRLLFICMADVTYGEMLVILGEVWDIVNNYSTNYDCHPRDEALVIFISGK